MVFTALPEVLRAIAEHQRFTQRSCPIPARRSPDYFWVLIVGNDIFPQGLVTPDLFKRTQGSERSSK